MIIVTTSNKYTHLLPVFFYLYNKYFGQPFTLLGYEKPSCLLPDNCTFVSMGVQGPVSEWSTDIRKWIEANADQFFIWMMEDSLIKQPVKNIPWLLCLRGVGRINLTNDVSKRPHELEYGVLYAAPDSRYRLSMQPSIWNRDYFLQYITDGLTPWEAETQDPVNDGWHILGLENPPVVSNEGVCKRDIYKLNLDGCCQEDIDHIKTIAEWMK